MGRRARDDKPRLRAGDKVRHYRILRLLGKGGGGEVYVARDTQLGRKVALKMIRPTMLGSKEAVERFIFEARATAKFNHPHIITIYEVGTFDGAPYVALEYLEGRSLRQLLHEQKPQAKEAVRIALAVAEALEEAHGAGILHRDLKPENIYIPRDGRLRVLDFGLAKRVDDLPAPGAIRAANVEQAGEEDPSDTPGEADTLLASSPMGVDTIAQDTMSAEPEDGLELAHFSSRGFDSSARRTVRGTPPYMAPEQWRLEEQTPKTDIWAFGVLLYELLTGLLPFRSLERAEVRASVTGGEKMPALRAEGGLPVGLVKLVADCLQKDPTRRPDASDARRALAELLVPSSVDLEEIQGPFRGLFSFDERHAHLFFGRDAEVAAFVEQLRTEAALAVLGPTGAGKSSFVKAGVVPRLREQGAWVVLRVRPGQDPFRALAARLVAGEELSDHFSSSITGSSAGRERMLADELREQPLKLGLMLRQLAEEQRARVLLLVDQLEEIQTQVKDSTLRENYLASLASVADEVDDPVRLVVTLRDDFLGKVAVSEAASRVLGRVVVLRRPSPAALRQIITRAPQEFGYRYDDPELVGEMIAEVAPEQACLPLLSFAGRMLWERRDKERRRLTREAYRQMGGVVGALATHADAVIEALTPVGRELARRLLQRMVTAENTRRLIDCEALLEGLGEQGEDVLGKLVDARLVVIRRRATADQSYELAHEALISGWQQLVRWLDSSREERVFAQELEQAATLWARRGRREEEVWRGEALREALISIERFGLALGEEAAAFIERGREREQASARARRRRQRMVRGAVLLGVLFALALLAGWGLTLRAKEREARRERARAEEQLAAAQRQGALLALDQGKTLRARALLRSALERGADSRARRLWWELSQRPRLWRHQLPQRPLRAAFAPHGDHVILVLEQGPLLRLDLASLQEETLVAAKEGIRDAAFVSPHELALIDKRGVITLLNLHSRARRKLGQHLDGSSLHGFRLLALPQKKLLYSLHRKLRRWSLAGQKSVNELVDIGDNGRLLRVVGGEVVTGAGFPSLTMHRAGKVFGRIERSLRHPPGHVDLSADGKLVATASLERHGMIEVGDPRGKRRCRANTRRWVSALRLSGDGRWLVLGTRDGHMQLWDAPRCRLLDEVKVVGRERYLRPGVRVWTVLVDFDARDQRVLVGSMHGELQLFDLATLAASSKSGHRKALMALAFGADGQELISGDLEGVLNVWDREGKLRRRSALGCTIRQLVVDGPRGALYVACDEGGVRKLDLRTLRPLARYAAGPHVAHSLALSPDGKVLAGALGNERVQLWNAEDGARLLEFAPKTGASALLFDLRGRLLTVGKKRHTLAFHALPSATLVKELRLPAGMGRSAAVALQLMQDGQIAVRLGAHDAFSVDPTSGKSEQIVPMSGPIYARSIVDPYDDETVIVPYDVGHGTGSAFLLAKRKSKKARLFFGGSSQLTSIAFDSKKELVASGGLDGQLTIWRRADGRAINHATLLQSAPPRLYTTMGIERVPGAAPRPPKKRWQRALVENGWLAAFDGRERWLCVATYDRHLELWDMTTDRRELRVPRAKVVEVAAIEGACVARWSKGAELLARGAAPRMLATDAIAIGSGPDDAFVVRRGGEIERFDIQGVRRRSWPRAMEQPAIVVPLERGLLLAATGQLALLRGKERLRMRLPLTARPTIARMLTPEVAAVGFASGELGVYQPSDGRELLHRQLKGPVTQLLRAGRSLHVATSQGDWRTVDLSAFVLDECALLRRVWAAAPARWSGGAVVRAGAPAGHRCASH